jgi:phage gp36-like protein
MFVTDDDYITLADAAALKIISQTSEDNRRKAERMGIEEITGYLSDRYNCSLVFSAQGDKRNPLVLMYTMDCALYHMCAWLPQKMGHEIRKERYDRALKWMEGVAKGLLNPTLPGKGDDGEGNIDEDLNSSLSWGSEPKNNNSW